MTDWMKSDDERKQILLKFSAQLVDKYVDFSYNRHVKSTSKDMVRDYGIQILSLGCNFLMPLTKGMEDVF